VIELNLETLWMLAMLAMFGLFLRGLQNELRRSLRRIAEDEAIEKAKDTPDEMVERELRECELQAEREFRAREARMRMIARRSLENPVLADPSLKSESN
jgi:hypothetical protein